MPQNAIFIEGTTSTVFLELRIKSDIDINQLKKSLIKILEMSSDQLFVLLSFSKSGFEKLGAASPDGLKDFETLSGIDKLEMPGTQSEIFIWAHSHSKSVIFDFVESSKKTIAPFLIIDLEQEGFRYHDSRDITGFVDGSANPKGDKRKQEILIPIGQPNENGCFVITQKWAHNLSSFLSHKIEDQEKIIGRTKVDSIELEGDAMPNNSHVSSVDLKVNGEAMKIYRRSFPFANKEDNGLFFLGFSKSIQRFDVQLKSMLGLSEDGISDRLMNFSKPESGSYYFAPSTKELLEILTPS